MTIVLRFVQGLPKILRCENDTRIFLCSKKIKRINLIPVPIE